jgi:predicted nucleic acid-binding protein
MIIFDTNLISEIAKPVCDPSVRAWLGSCDLRTVYTTAINVAELRAGIEVLPEGKRRDAIQSSNELLLATLFKGKLLSFDAAAAESFGRLAGFMKRIGRAVSPADAYIASIALVHNYQIATRDVQPFLDAGLTVVNPWDHPLK